MDINPRTWGWISYYLDGLKNPKSVFENKERVKLEMKSIWINIPRLLMANLKGKYVFPSIKSFFLNQICYESYF